MSAFGGASVREALDSAVIAIAAAGSDTPRLDAEVLLAEALGIDRTALFMDPGREVKGPAVRAFQDAVRRRSAGREPVAYIIGRRGFRHLELAVDARVLVPRPETELLVEVGLELLAQGARVADVGTGSGAVALALAQERPDLEIVATDLSADALVVARANAARLGLERARRVPRRRPARGAARSTPCSPTRPTSPRRERATLAPEITRHEPRGALFAGPDGLDVIRRLVPAAAQAGARLLAIEVGAGQAAGVGGADAPRGVHRRRGAPRPRGDRARGGGHAMNDFERCIAAGGVAIFPADTVYGLACDPTSPPPSRACTSSRAGRPTSPRRSMFFTLDAALAALPELGPRLRGALRGAAARARSPCCCPTRSRRYPLACGPDPWTLGLRVPAAGMLGATRRAGPAVQRQPLRRGRPARGRGVDPALRGAADLVVDGGELPGTPSTVVDLRDYERKGCGRSCARARCPPTGARQVVVPRRGGSAALV